MAAKYYNKHGYHGILIPLDVKMPISKNIVFLGGIMDIAMMSRAYENLLFLRKDEINMNGRCTNSSVEDLC